jgi:hypothetical protein
MLLATVAAAQNFALDSFTLDSGGGTSTGGVFAVSGIIGQPQAEAMSGGGFSLTGEFPGLMDAPPSADTLSTIFDNTPGGESGGFGATTNLFLAGKICLGSQPYRLDSLSLLLSSGNFSGNTQPPSTVRLRIFSHDTLSGKPAANTGLILNLSGRTNPIVLQPFDLTRWTPATPFTLAADTCYWVVLSVDAGAVAGWIHSGVPPVGVAGTFGFTRSVDSGGTWVIPDNTANYKMLIEGIAVPTPQILIITSVSISGNDLRLSFPTLSSRSYAIESRLDLAAGGWVSPPGMTNIGTGASLQITISNAFTQPQQFYQVKELP